MHCKNVCSRYFFMEDIVWMSRRRKSSRSCSVDLVVAAAEGVAQAHIVAPTVEVVGVISMRLHSREKPSAVARIKIFGSSGRLASSSLFVIHDLKMLCLHLCAWSMIRRCCILWHFCMFFTGRSVERNAAGRVLVCPVTSFNVNYFSCFIIILSNLHYVQSSEN